MNDKVIPLKAVRDALMLAAIRQKLGSRSLNGGPPMGRYAAYTQYPDFFDASCRRKRRTANMAPRMNCGPMTRGDIERVLEVVRWRGLPEVRRTFGAGMRALQAEFASGMLR